MKNAPRNNVFYRNQNWHYPRIKSGKGIYLYDDYGKEYIDGCSGSAVVNIGHGDKRIAKYAFQQIKTLAYTHLSRFTTEVIEKCAKKIASLTPGDLNHVYFLSGGSEAVETAMKLVRQYFVERDKHTSKHLIISRWNSFHGNTLGALSLTGITNRRKIYEPLIKNFPKINQCYCYRCPYNQTYPDCKVLCAYDLDREIMRLGAENIAAFIAEPIIGSAAPGLNPPQEYFQIIKDICDKNDILLVVDEVMSSFGRTGKNFAIEHYGIVPDIIVTGKGLGAGYTPIGATIANTKIFETIMIEGTGFFIHGHTYGGNPLSAGIANEVLQILQKERLMENAAVQGEYLLKKLQQLYEYPIVGDIRGKGLMIGIEFVKNKATKEPFAPNEGLSEKITMACLNEGLVVYPGGGSTIDIKGDHILLAPPLTINKGEVKKLLARLEKAIDKVVQKNLCFAVK